MIINAKKSIIVILLIVLIIALVFGIKYSTEFFYQQNYPRNYSEYVETFSSEYEIDKNMLYAVIKTESDFEPAATSNVGARGLTQIMENTFYWIKSKLKDDDTIFEDMYSPKENIRYGAFLLSYLYNEFGSYDTALAAYHAGRSAVANWLNNKTYSSDGKTLNHIPIADTEHYVGKVKKCYDMYQKIYESEKEG